MKIEAEKTLEADRYGKYSGTLPPGYDDYFNHEHIGTMTSCINSDRKEREDKGHGKEGEIIEKIIKKYR